MLAVSNTVTQSFVREASRYMAVIRRPLFVLAVVPVWMVMAALFLSIWPWRPALGHLIVLGMCGAILAYVCLHGFQKIPFTCSYLPGKSHVHMAFLGALGFLMLALRGIALERRALQNPATYARMVVVLGMLAVVARWRTVVLAKSEEAIAQFEEVAPPAILSLGLNRDGVLPIEPQST
jgi:hypothetical protein